jgi:RNA polymerase sigma-70 factor, ECF subfamily
MNKSSVQKVAHENNSSDDNDDSDVMGLVAHGDMTAALGRLMQRHGAAVYRYCREALRDPALADDVQQQVFIAAYRDLPGFHRRSSLRTWLLGIARHRVLDAVKARRRGEAYIGEGDATLVADSVPAPGERIDDVRLMQALVKCLEQLRQPVRAALLLRFQQGMTFEDMSRVCDEKPGTLQATVTRALPRLRECIEASTGGLV